MRTTEVERLDVYRDRDPVATLERTPSGCRFQYLPEYSGQAIARHLPVGEPIETRGDNLPPFFANLLPEGARLNALIVRAQTSPSDMFSLLVEAGIDCIGDVFAVPEGKAWQPAALYTSTRSLPKTDFRALLDEATISFGDASIPGVQEKFSVSDATISLPLSTATSSSILKLSPPSYPHLVENEHFFNGVAKACGLATPRIKLLHDIRGVSGLLIQRFDRLRSRNGVISRLHQEDGCQLCNAYPADRARLSSRLVAQAISESVTAPIPEALEFIRRYVFAYVMANADLHAKNISIYRTLSPEITRQTPCYDLICTAPYPSLLTRMTLKIDAKDDRFRVSDFVRFGDRFGVPEPIIRSSIQKLIKLYEPWIERVAELPHEPKDVQRAQNLMQDRVDSLRRDD